MSTDKPRRTQFQLRTLLLLVAFIGIVTGWFADRNRLTQGLRELEAVNQIRQDQIESLQQQLSVRYGAMQIRYWWASADAFIEMLTTASDEDKFLEMAPSLASSNDAVFRDAVAQMTALLDSPDERTQRRSAIALRFLQQSAPNRMTESAASIVAKAIPLLEDDSGGAVAGEAIFMIQAFGPAASEAVEALKNKMGNDSDHWAPAAAMAAAEIDSTIDISTRLVEFVRMKHPCWYETAFHMSRYVDHEMARRVITGVLDEAKTEAERNAAIQALNQIPPRTEQTDAAEP